MAKTILPPKWVVTLLGRLGDNRYSIVPPGGKYGNTWVIALYTPLSMFECSEVMIAKGLTVYDAIKNAFPVLGDKHWKGNPLWNPNNWRKGKYVG